MADKGDVTIPDTVDVDIDDGIGQELYDMGKGEDE